jgi:hypothetical protein
MTCNPGTISPAANNSMVNRPPLISLTRLAKVSAEPYKISRDVGQLVAIFQRTVGNEELLLATDPVLVAVLPQAANTELVAAPSAV